MTALYDTGVDIQIDPDPSQVKVKAAVLLGTTDLQGKAYLLDMTQHNGENGCLTCEEPGCVVKQGKGHSRCYPYRPSSEGAPKRTTSSFLENALEAHRSRNKYIMSVGDVTSLALMPWFDIVLGMVPDYMHGCLLGVTKALLNKWFSPKNCKKPYFVGKKIGKINKRFLKMRPPDFVSRLPRNLEKHYKNFKASELQSWLLYYSIPCLLGYLPDKYLRHFCHLSEGIYILLGDEISQSSLSRARDLLDTFYKEFQELYGDGSCGLNVHNTGAHLVDYVEGWGPLWAWSNFGFEDMNGTILDFAHGTGNVCRQLLWMLHAQSRLRSDVELMQAGMLKDFVTRMLSTKREVKNLKTVVGCSVAGGTSKLSGLSPSLNEKVERMGQGTSKFKVLRIMRNGQMFCSTSWKRMVKRNSSVVLLSSGKIAEIQFFIWIKESGKVLAVFREIPVDEQNPFLFESAGHHILNMKPISCELQVSDVKDIQEKVVLMGDDEQHLFISRAPNFCGVCG